MHISSLFRLRQTKTQNNRVQKKTPPFGGDASVQIKLYSPYIF